jgi:hypothetical protein
VGDFGACVRPNLVPKILGKVWRGSMPFFPSDRIFYMLLTTPICWFIWIIGNKMTFDGYNLKNQILRWLFSQCVFPQLMGIII